jgi:hypothetical protein
MRRSPHGGGPNSLYDEKHGIKMGVPDGGCDDGKVSQHFCSKKLFKNNCVRKIIVFENFCVRKINVIKMGVPDGGCDDGKVSQHVCSKKLFEK